MILPMYLYSQDTLKITNEHIRIANSIFLEHKKFSEQIPLLHQQINNLNQINKSWENTDSINNVRINNYLQIIESQDKSLKRLNKSLKIKKDVIIYGGIIAVVLCLIMK